MVMIHSEQALQISKRVLRLSNQTKISASIPLIRSTQAENARHGKKRDMRHACLFCNIDDLLSAIAITSPQ